MKWIVACVLAGTTFAAAAPDVPPYQWPAKRKPPIEKYSVEALTKFVDAVIADKAGSPYDAASHYRSLLDDGHASTPLQSRGRLAPVEHYPQAVEFYKKYLAALPDAPDRKDVERIIELIEKRPSVAVIDGEDPDAVIFFDGKLLGSSPAIVMPSPGGIRWTRIGRRPMFTSRSPAFLAHTSTWR